MPLVILVAIISYVRFVVAQDYFVTYEGECDPYTQSCYIGCEDDECISEYYYSIIEKYVPDLYEQCGPDITNCAEANVCLPSDGDDCRITFCDPEIEACEELTRADYDL